MSDFDKEAERERLREKYEKEQEKREVTEKMSELLLQGATMTNAHCSDCGDPIFRYDGQEFCATCEKAVERDTGQEDGAEGEADDEPADAAENGQPDDQIEVTRPSDEARVRFGAEGEGDAESERTDQAPDADAEPQQAAAGRGDDTAPVEPTPASASPTADETREIPGVEPDAVGDLEAARASLTRTVTDLAQRAEASDDLGRKRELLAATEEAAEALEAVRDAGR